MGLVYRFEGWVQYQSRRPLGRVDLGPLAAELTERESDGARWSWAWPRDDNPPIPWLRLDDGASTSIPIAEIRSRLQEYLATTPPSHDPYADEGRVVPY